MADYARFVALAQRLIEANGREITVQKLDATPEEEAKPWNGPGEPTVDEDEEVETYAVNLSHASTVDLGALGIDEDLLKRVERVLLVAANGTDELDTFQQILDGEETWGIDWVRTLKPGPTTILYVFGVKR